MAELTLKLILFLFPLAYSPGPGNMFFAANGARFGISATIPANAGYHIATWTVTLTIGLGFGWFAAEFPEFLVIIRYLGSAYVFYLAWCLLRADMVEDGADARRADFRDGVILPLLNPKAYVIIALMFTQFTAMDGGNSTTAILLITTIFTLNNLVTFSVWAYAGDRLAAIFRRNSSARRLNIVFGLMLAIVALWMLFG